PGDRICEAAPSSRRSSSPPRWGRAPAARTSRWASPPTWAATAPTRSRPGRFWSRTNRAPPRSWRGWTSRLPAPSPTTRRRATAAAPAPDRVRPAVRFLALGDSYTIGEGVSPEERWPVRLAALLREDGLEAEEPVLVARTGWTTDELSAALDAADPRGPFDLVSLLVGVNDQYRGRGLGLSIPGWGVTPFAEGRDRTGIAREIDAFNAINRSMAGERGARYVDVTPASRRAGGEPGLLAADGLHPSGRAYAEWAALA